MTGFCDDDFFLLSFFQDIRRKIGCTSIKPILRPRNMKPLHLKIGELLLLLSFPLCFCMSDNITDRNG